MEKQGIGHFLKYNNAVPIVLGFLFLSTSATMAASPAVRDSVYAAQSSVQAVDNSYILGADIDSYPFTMRVTSVTEDGEHYYLSYDFDTIAIVDGVWQGVISKRELRVSKALLGEGDLEAYAESELSQVRSREMALLKETKAFEARLGLSQKTVATVYSGIVGKFIDPSEEIIPQYIGTIAKDDPLRVKHPVPLVTWDQNAEPEEVPPEEGEDDGPTIIYPPSQDPPSDPPPQDPPPTDPPAEDPPAEEPPAEEPPAEEPPAEEPEPEPEPQPDPEPAPEPSPEPGPSE